MAMQFALQIMVPGEEPFLTDVKQRNKFIITKHIYGFAGEDSSGGTLAPRIAARLLGVCALSTVEEWSTWEWLLHFGW